MQSEDGLRHLPLVSAFAMVKRGSGGSLRRNRRSISASITGVSSENSDERAEAAAALHEQIESDKTGPKMLAQIVKAGGVEALSGMARGNDDDAAELAVGDLVQIFSKGDKSVTKSVVEAGGLETLRAVASSGGPKAAAVAAAFLEQCPDGVRTAERRRTRRESLRTADVAALAADAPPE